MANVKRQHRELGEKILDGRYEILKVIHCKGMANVYRVADSKLNKDWCLKEIVKSKVGADKKSQLEYRCLLQEAQVLKTLSHPNIPRIVTIEQEEDYIFIIMDYVDGISIGEWINRKGRIKQDVVVTWMKQVCQTMLYLHNRKNPVFYRDMKPDNLMLQSDGNIKLIDFGISVIIKEEGQVIKEPLGTRGYAAPEQAKKGNICDLRSDIFAMGRTMYYMLTGLNPSQLPKGSSLKPLRSIDSSISVGLENIVMKCMMPEPDDRYQSCEELLYDLQNYKTLDTAHRVSMRRKVYLVVGMFITSIFLIITSFIPLGMYNAKERNEYNNLLTVAEQSGRSEDYEAVLEKNASKMDPYLGYIDSIKIDGVFSNEEEIELLGYLNPNIEDLKKDKNYGELAYSIGKLYWFYYQGDSDDAGMIISVKWFKDAMDLGYNEELSSVYYELGSFRKNVSSSVIESSDGGIYKSYWENLIKAKDLENGELVNLQLNLAIANCMSTYCYNLKSDGVSCEEVREQLNELNEFVTVYTPSIEKAEASYNSLKQTLTSLEEKVSFVYGGNK